MWPRLPPCHNSTSLCGPAVEARSGLAVNRIEGKSRRILSVQLEPPLPAGALVLLQPTARSLLGDNPILQEVRPDGSLAVLADNLEYEDVDLEPGVLVGSVQEVTATPAMDQASDSPPPEASTHEEFDALPQAEKIKWLAAQFRLEDAPALQRDPRLRKEVLRTLLQFSDVISIGGYGKTNLITHPINVHPGTEPIKMKHRPLNPVMEESLRQQIDRWLEQRVVEEADSPWSFPLVPVPKKNSKEIRWAVDYRKLNAVTKKDAFPLPNIADNLSRLAGSRVFSALDGAGAFHAVPVRRAEQGENSVFLTLWTIPVCSDAVWVGQCTCHLLEAGRQSTAPPTLVRSTLLSGRHGCPLTRCLGPSPCPAESPDRFPSRRPTNLARKKSPVVQGPYQVLGSRD